MNRDSPRDIEHRLHELEKENAQLKAALKNLAEDSGDGCHLCKYFPCAESNSHCLGWEWGGNSAEIGGENANK